MDGVLIDLLNAKWNTFVKSRSVITSRNLKPEYTE